MRSIYLFGLIILLFLLIDVTTLVFAEGSYTLTINPSGSDFSITGFYDGKFVGYVSPIANLGRWTDIRGYGNPGTQNILDAGGGFYDHPALWWGGTNWSDGTCFSYTIDTSMGKVVSWHGKWRNAAKGFDSDIISQKVAVNTSGMIVVKSDIKMTITQPAADINGLWVEFGWHMNDYSTTAIVRRNGYSSTSVTSIIPQNMAGQPGSHYFDGQLLYTSNGDYICGYGGTTYNVAVAYIPLGWDSGNTSYCRSWDTNSTIDQTDTMELHFYNPVNFGTYKSATVGEVHQFSYYLVVSANGQTGYNWIPAISELDQTISEGTSTTTASPVIFDMEPGNPVTNTWIGGSGIGTQATATSNSVYKNGTSGLRWTYTFGAVTGGNYPTMEMAVPGNKTNWTGATTLGTWMYFDLTGTKTYWTIQPVICHPYPSAINDLGNWNAGPTGVPNNTWVWHEWPLPVGNYNNVTHVRFYYHDGDGWAALSKSNQVNIYLDDVTAVAMVPVELSAFSAE